MCECILCRSEFVFAGILVPVFDGPRALLLDSLHTIGSDHAAVALTNDNKSWNSRNVIFLLQSLQKNRIHVTESVPKDEQDP